MHWKYYAFYLIVLFCLVHPREAIAQPAGGNYQGEPKAILKADHQEVRVGDTVKITMKVTYPPDFKLAGSLKYPEVKGLEPHGMTLTQKSVVNRYTTEETSRIFKAVKDGKFLINPITVIFVDTDRNTIEIKTNGLSIVVLTEGAPEEGLRDIKGLRETKDPFNWHLMSIIGAIFLAAALFVFAVLMAMRKKSPVRIPLPVYLDLEDEYIEKLRMLLIPDEFDAKGVMETYLKMSDIMRSYLSNRWGITAREETTIEVVRDLKRAKFGQDILDAYSDIALAFDMVKYAKGRPFAGDMEKTRSAAINFIRPDRR